MRTFFKSILTLIAAIFFVSLQSETAHATHAAGANLTYTCLGNNQYQFRLTFYRDCAGVARPSTAPINLRAASCGFNTNLTLQLIPGTGNEVTVPCATATSTCSGGSTPGLQEWVYQGIANLPQCADWVFSYSLCCRNNAITNLVSPGSRNLYVESQLDNLNAPCNSSPQFTNPPVSFVCVNQNFTFNQGVIDADGDSLAYTLINPRHAATTNIPYTAGFSATNPLSSTPPLTLNPITGDINFTPTALQVTVISVLVDEFRNGVKIGSVLRDIQIWVINCQANTLPTVSGVDGTNSYATTVCAGQNLCFDVFANDPDAGQTVTINWNAAIPGATFTSNGATLPTGTFCWTPGMANISNIPYIFTVTVRDDACPLNGVQVFSYSITVVGMGASLGPDVVSCLSPYTLSPTITNGTAPFSYSWNNGETGSSLSATSSGNYSVTVTDANGCVASSSVNLSISSDLTLSAVISDVTCAGYADGSIDITVGGGTAPFSYNWSNGTTDAINGNLGGGTYSLTVTDDIGCTVSGSYSVSEPSTLDILVAVSVGTGGFSLSCNSANGAADGSASVSISGGTSPYSVLWSDGQTTMTATGLAAGSYTVEITDANGCTVSGNATLTEPDPIVFNTAEPCVSVVTGYGSNNCATISASSPTGGTAPYTYAWSNGANTASITVCPGVSTNYTVTVTDANGCTAEASTLVQVVDLSCGPNGKNVRVCHVPPGNPNNPQSICIAPPAVPAHIVGGGRGHGTCYLGICGGNDPCNSSPRYSEEITDYEEGIHMHVFPNPAEKNATLLVSCNTCDDRQPARFFITDITGKELIMENIFLSGSMEQYEINLSNLSPGLYFVIVQSEGFREVQKLQVK